MSASTETIEQARPRAISLRWIINAREDLIWFIGSVASSYALLLLYITGVLPLIPMGCRLGDSDRCATRLRHVIANLLRRFGMENA